MSDYLDEVLPEDDDVETVDLEGVDADEDEQDEDLVA
jgi:hypothetical protein